MSFQVTFKYKDGPSYPLDLPKAPNVMNSIDLLEKITGLHKEIRYDWSPSHLVGNHLRTPPSIGKISSFAAVALVSLIAIVALAIFWPKAALIVGAALLAIGFGLTTCGLISDRKKHFQDQEKRRTDLNNLGKIVGDHKDKLLEAASNSSHAIDQEINNLVKFFFPQS